MKGVWLDGTYRHDVRRHRYSSKRSGRRSWRWPFFGCLGKVSLLEWDGEECSEKVEIWSWGAFETGKTCGYGLIYKVWEACCGMKEDELWGVSDGCSCLVKKELFWRGKLFWGHALANPCLRRCFSSTLTCMSKKLGADMRINNVHLSCILHRYMLNVLFYWASDDLSQEAKFWKEFWPKSSRSEVLTNGT